MRKGLNKALKIGGLVCGSIIVLLVVAALLVFFDKPVIRKISQSYISKKAGLPIQIGRLDYTFFPLKVTLSEVKTTYKNPIFTMDISIDRLEVTGNLRRLLNGTKPAFDTVDVDVGQVRFVQEIFSPEPIDISGIIQQISSILAYTQQVSIACGRLSLKLPGQNLAFEKLILELSKAAAANVYELHLTSDKTAVGMNDGSFSLESPLRLDGAMTFAPTVSANIRLALDAARVSAAGLDGTLTGLTIDITGSLDMSENKVRIASLTLAAPGLLDVSASGSAELNKPLFLEASGDIHFENLESLAAILGPSLPPDLRNFRIWGRSRLTGKYTIPPGLSINSGSLEASLELDRVGLAADKAKTPIQLTLFGTVRAAVSPADAKGASGAPSPLKATLDFNRLLADYTGPGLPLKLTLSGRIKTEGTPPDFRVSADIRSDLGALARDHLSIRSSSIRLLAEGTKNSAKISLFDAALEGVSVALPGDKKFFSDAVKVKGSGRAEIAQKSIVVSALDMQLPTLPPLRLSGRFDMPPLGIRQAHFETRDVKIPILREVLDPFLPPVLADWEADGTIGIELDVKNRLPPFSGWELSGAVDISGLRFNDASFSIAGESLNPHIRIKGEYELSTGAIDGTGALELSQGESLWKDVYISWSRHPLTADLAGRYDPASGTIDGILALFNFPTIGNVRAAGTVRLVPSPSFDLKAQAKLGLDPLYSLYSQSGAPPESRLRLAGEVSADLVIARGEGGITVDGRAKVDASEITNPAAKLAMRGFKADLPVHLELGEAPPAGRGDDSSSPSGPPHLGLGDPADKGFLRVFEIRTPSLTLEPPDLHIAAGTNAFRIEPFAWELFGGRFEFGEIALRLDPATRKFQGTGSLRLPELDLSRLPVATSRFPLTGRARIDFPGLDITPAEISAKGQADIDIFGGRVVISHFSVSNPLAKGRKISCDVEIQDLDLKKITDIVPFGEVTGIIRGEVRGLTISYGQPERFTLILESVPRKGVAQTFSLKAVDSLTVLSSGQKASAGGSRIFMRFIRGFRYAKIGITSTLKNDTFTLNGMIHEDGVEYLVKKPALFGINVINRMPDKKISFKEMMNRLRRIGQSEAPTAKK